MPVEESVQKTREAPQSTPPERGRSTILFPYQALDEAIEVAKGIHTLGGSHCQVDQLAAHRKLAVDASMFRLGLNTARIFGLITYTQGIATLTTLGARICDPQQEPAAKAEAFLNVPLYAKIYEQFKGANLPPASGLETAMVNMGVAVKQKRNARQVFQRAAMQAGFFAFGQSRLVYPTIKGSTASAVALEPHSLADHEKPLDAPKNNGGGDDSGGRQEPLIVGLIKALPSAGESWTVEARRKWLQLAATVFDVIYKDAGDGASVRIEIQKDSAK